MKKQLLFIIAIIASFSVNGQWEKKNVGIPAGHYVNYLSIPASDIVWGTTIDITSQTAAPTRTWVKSTDGGNTWSKGLISSAPTSHEVSNISAIDGNTAWVAMFNETAGSGGGVYKTTDGGTTWVRQNTAIYNSSSFPNVVHFWDANTGFTMGDPNGGYFEIYTTTDGGTTWVRTPSANIPANQTGEYGIVNMYAVIGNTIWFGTSDNNITNSIGGRVYKSVDRGLNWTVVSTGLKDITDIEFTDSLNGMVKGMEPDTYMATTDGGATWNPVTYFGVLYNYDFSAVPNSVGMYVSVGEDAGGSTGSSYSLDYGVNWTDITYDTLTSVDFFDVYTGWAGGISAGTTGGIYKWDVTFLGMEDIAAKNSLSIAPNPSDGVFKIDLSNIKESEITTSVIDAIGRKVYTDNTSYGSMYKTIDLSAFPAGMYYVRIFSQKNTFTQKIIKY